MTLVATPTLRGRMIEAFALRGLFALERWTDEQRNIAAYQVGPAHEAAVERAERWHAEAMRAERIVSALEGMADGVD